MPDSPTGGIGDPYAETPRRRRVVRERRHIPAIIGETGASVSRGIGTGLLEVIGRFRSGLKILRIELVESVFTAEELERLVEWAHRTTERRDPDLRRGVGLADASAVKRSAPRERGPSMRTTAWVSGGLGEGLLWITARFQDGTRFIRVELLEREFSDREILSLYDWAERTAEQKEPNARGHIRAI